jgi:3-dehydroquinate dehydratase-2
MANKKKIALINGPNLQATGQRQTHIYGNRSFDDFFQELSKTYADLAELSYFQSNIEGKLIDALYGYRETHNGIILNAGAYTHTSLALADAVAAMNIPVIEVHISNIFSREHIRHQSLIGAYCVGVIAGFGLKSYQLALAFLTAETDVIVS